MAPICPRNLLNLLQVLLDENGGIVNKTAVGRTVSLMKKFSRKLVSKCIYVHVLKTTRTDVLREFLVCGGWELTYNWLAISAATSNWPMAEEILELFLLSPVDYQSLKSTAAPALVKKLAKEGQGKLAILAKHLLSQWLKLVESHMVAPKEALEKNLIQARTPTSTTAAAAVVSKNSVCATVATVATPTVTSTVVTSACTRVVVSDAAISVQGCVAPNVSTRSPPAVVSSNESLGDEIKNSVEGSADLSAQPIVSLPSTDSSIVKSKVEDEALPIATTHEVAKSSPISSPIPITRSSRAADCGKPELDSATRSDLSEVCESSATHARDVPDGKHKEIKEQKTERSSEKEQKPKSAKSAKSETERKDRIKEKRSSSSQKKSLSSTSSKSKSLPSSSSSSKSNSSSSKGTSTSSTKEKNKVRHSSSKGKEKHKNDSSSSSRKHKSSSSAHSKSSDSSVNLPIKKDDKRRDEIGTNKISELASESRPASPPKTTTIENKDSPNKRPLAAQNPVAKKEKLESGDSVMEVSVNSESKKSQNKKTNQLFESSIFGDMLNAMAESKRPVKRKRPAASASGSPNGPKIAAVTSANEDPKDKTEGSAVDAADDSKPNISTSDEAGKDAVTAEHQEEPSESAEVVVKVPGPGCGPNGPPSILVIDRRSKPKKKLRWREDDKLVDTRTFEFDATERVNVTKAGYSFADMKNMELMNERKLMTNAAVKRGEDRMRPQTEWRKLIEVGNLAPYVTGQKSTEREKQQERELTTLRVIYFSPEMIPDSPAEPLPEAVSPIEPRPIPLEDVLGHTPVNDYTTQAVPEPRGWGPNAIHMDISGRPLPEATADSSSRNATFPLNLGTMPAFAQSGLISDVLKSNIPAAAAATSTVTVPQMAVTTMAPTFQAPPPATLTVPADPNGIWQQPPLAAAIPNFNVAGGIPNGIVPQRVALPPGAVPPGNFISGPPLNGFVQGPLGPAFNIPGPPQPPSFPPIGFQQAMLNGNTCPPPVMLNGGMRNNNGNNYKSNNSDSRFRGDNNNHRRNGNHGSSNGNGNGNGGNKNGGWRLASDSGSGNWNNKKKNHRSKRRFKPF